MLRRAPTWVWSALVLTLLVGASSVAEAGRYRLPARHHVLNRAGYGPAAWSQQRIEQLGAEAYIQEQLQPATIPDPELEALLAQFPSLDLGFQELRATYGSDSGQLPRADIVRELQRAKILRAVASRRQLQEVLVDFWVNHFNVNAVGSRREYDISPYERLVIRPHVLGRFEDLLLAVARSPAMGDYLDNRRNRAGAINENYSRELMELHTLGVDGGYSEADVVEVARCLTGWREDYDQPDGFGFRDDLHDQEPKSIMGVLEIPANGGYQDGVAVLQFLAAHPKTAEQISRKLVVRFVSEAAPPALVAQAASVFLASGGDLRQVLTTILLSPEFLDAEETRRSKVKRPLHVLASVARSTNADPAQLDLAGMSRKIRDMGEELFRAGPPTGYPDVSEFWTSPGTLLLRFNAVERAARGRDGYVFSYPVAGGSAETIAYSVMTALFLDDVAEETRQGLLAFLGGLTVSDEQRVEQAAAYLLSSPEFLKH